MDNYRKEIDQHLLEFFRYFSNEGISNVNISIESYIKIKARYSGKRICELLKVNESTLLNFEKAIRNYFKHQNNDELDYISQIRLMYFLEFIFKNLQISFSIKLRQNSSSEELILKKVRALELVIRDVITEHNGGKESLIKTLNEFFKSEIVQQWLKNADETGVLSGTTFSELSALFLHSRLFPKYDALFIQDKGLNYEKSKTDSLMYFLNDIRIIRNILAHNKKVSEIQIELVNQYYKEIIGRIEMAFSTGMTKVNPVIHLNPSSSDINVFKSSLKEEIDDVLTP